MATLDFNLNNLPKGIPVDVEVEAGGNGFKIERVPVELSTSSEIALKAKLDPLSQITANLAGNVVATVNPSSQITANLAGEVVATINPSSLITANIAGIDNKPVHAHIGLRNTTIEFRPLNLFSLFTIRILP